MPRRSFVHFTRKSARLLACLLATVAFFAAPNLRAMTLVPMCGEHAETIAAPPIMRPARDSVLRAGPCDVPSEPLLDASRSTPHPDQSAAFEIVPRLPAISHRLPPVPHLTRLGVEYVSDGERPGFVRSLERPPR